MAKFDVVVSLRGFLFSFGTVGEARDFLANVDDQPKVTRKKRTYKKRAAKAAKKTTRKPRAKKAPKVEASAA
jgi:hypothetical protein